MLCMHSDAGEGTENENGDVNEISEKLVDQKLSENNEGC